jgi:hypothetical protein
MPSQYVLMVAIKGLESFAKLEFHERFTAFFNVAGGVRR